MKEVGILDLRTFDFKLADGEAMSVSMIEKDEARRHGGMGGHAVAVSINVGGKDVLTSDSHFATVGDLGLDEYMLYGLTSCLGHHLRYWVDWQMFMSIAAEALADQVRPELADVPELEGFDGLPVRATPLAARHIEQLTDAQTVWWVNTTNGRDDGSAYDTLYKVGREAFLRMREKNPDLFG